MKGVKLVLTDAYVPLGHRSKYLICNAMTQISNDRATWICDTGMCAKGASFPIVDIPIGAKIWAGPAVKQIDWSIKPDDSDTFKMFPSLDFLCPSCGPSRGTMLRNNESNCWRCGWVK